MPLLPRWRRALHVWRGGRVVLRDRADACSLILGQARDVRVPFGSPAIARVLGVPNGIEAIGGDRWQGAALIFALSELQAQFLPLDVRFIDLHGASRLDIRIEEASRLDPVERLHWHSDEPSL